MAHVFRGGIYFKDDKTARGSGVVTPACPGTLSVPFAGENELLIPVGARVLKGQIIARQNGKMSALHSPVSGTVTELVTVSGIPCVRIENDGRDEISPDIAKMRKKLADCSSGEIIDKIRAAGICGMGGDGEDTADKLERAFGHVDTCIINCAECEPYISCDMSALSEAPAAVVNGLKIFLRALGIRKGVIAVPEGNPGIIKKLGELTKESRMIGIMTTSAKYPAGDERRLVYAYTGRELQPYADPISLGCVIFNVQTCLAVYDAFVSGMPLTRRVVTVGGDCFRSAVDLSVPIGTMLSDLVKFAGEMIAEPKLILDGGPLRGQKTDLDRPVGKTTRAVTLFSGQMADNRSDPPVCVRCGKCVSLCPERLMPNYIYNYLRDGKTDAAVERGALRCAGCGICSYICPGNAPVAELIADFKSKRNSNVSDMTVSDGNGGENKHDN